MNKEFHASFAISWVISSLGLSCPYLMQKIFIYLLYSSLLYFIIISLKPSLFKMRDRSRVGMDGKRDGRHWEGKRKETIT